MKRLNFIEHLRNIKRMMKRYIKVEFKGSLDTSIEESLCRFSVEINDKEKVKREIKKAYILSGFIPEEFLMFGLYRMDKRVWNQYLSGAERKRKVFQICTEKSRAIFTDKYKTYELYKPYYHRDVIKIEQMNDLEPINCFIEKHDRFIVKPTGGYQGTGVHIVDARVEKDAVIDDVMGCVPCVLEELIVQADALEKFHPNSVNSVRVVSCLTPKGVEILFAILRMGVGENVIDNIGAGGIVAAIDIDTGMVCSDGYRYNGDVFKEHPDTDVKICGTTIPYWTELLQIVEELSVIIPEQKIIGWDFALTNDGWSIIEANHSPSCKSIQMIQGGIKNRFNQIWETAYNE